MKIELYNLSTEYTSWRTKSFWRNPEVESWFILCQVRKATHRLSTIFNFSKECLTFYLWKSFENSQLLCSNSCDFLWWWESHKFAEDGVYDAWFFWTRINGFSQIPLSLTFLCYDETIWCHCLRFKLVRFCSSNDQVMFVHAWMFQWWRYPRWTQWDNPHEPNLRQSNEHIATWQGPNNCIIGSIVPSIGSIVPSVTKRSEGLPAP